jgi:hypothetical protein
VPGTNAWWQIRVNLCKKDGRRAQISRVGFKLLNEIYPKRNGKDSSIISNISPTLDHWNFK